MREQLIELFLGWGGLSNCAEDMADYLRKGLYGRDLPNQVLQPILRQSGKGRSHKKIRGQKGGVRGRKNLGRNDIEGG